MLLLPCKNICFVQAILWFKWQIEIDYFINWYNLDSLTSNTTKYLYNCHFQNSLIDAQMAETQRGGRGKRSVAEKTKPSMVRKKQRRKRRNRQKRRQRRRFRIRRAFLGHYSVVGHYVRYRQVCVQSGGPLCKIQTGVCIKWWVIKWDTDRCVYKVVGHYMRYRQVCV